MAVPNADGSLVIFGDEDQSEAAAFMDSTIDAASATNKIRVALFGPEPLANFPEPLAYHSGAGADRFAATR